MILDKIKYIEWYLNEGKYFPVLDEVDRLQANLIHKHFLHAIFQLGLMAFSILLFYFLVIRPNIQRYKNRNTPKPGNEFSLQDHFVTLVSTAIAWGIALALLYMVQPLASIPQDQITQNQNPAQSQTQPPETEEEKQIFSCWAKRAKIVEHLHEQLFMASPPSLTVEKYREIKSQLNEIKCPEPHKTENNFTQNEEELTRQEKGKLVAALKYWAIIGICLLIAGFLPRKLKKYFESKLN